MILFKCPEANVVCNEIQRGEQEKLIFNISNIGITFTNNSPHKMCRLTPSWTTFIHFLAFNVNDDLVQRWKKEFVISAGKMPVVNMNIVDSEAVSMTQPFSDAPSMSPTLELSNISSRFSLPGSSPNSPTSKTSAFPSSGSYNSCTTFSSKMPTCVSKSRFLGHRDSSMLHYFTSLSSNKTLGLSITNNFLSINGASDCSISGISRSCNYASDDIKNDDRVSGNVERNNNVDNRENLINEIMATKNISEEQICRNTNVRCLNEHVLHQENRKQGLPKKLHFLNSYLQPGDSENACDVPENRTSVVKRPHLTPFSVVDILSPSKFIAGSSTDRNYELWHSWGERPSLRQSGQCETNFGELNFFLPL